MHHYAIGLRLLKNKCSSNPMTRLVPNQNMELRRKGNAVIVMEDSIVNTKACYARNAHRICLCRKAGFATEIFSMERERELSCLRSVIEVEKDNSLLFSGVFLESDCFSQSFLLEC